MQKLKPYFKYILIGILILIILLQRACSGDTVTDTPKPKIQIKYDTVYKYIHDTVQHDVHIKDIIYKESTDPQYVYDDNFCEQRFKALVKEYLKETVYEDTLKVDSLGYIVIVDTVSKNALRERLYIKDLKIPTITKTVTITKPADPVRQLYIGGNLFTDAGQSTLIIPSLIYKDRKDRVYQINAGIDNQGRVHYGLGIYWKIKLHK